MSKLFVQELGDVIEWTAAADITSDDFIDVGGKLGIALASCASGEKVSVRMVGVIRGPKGGAAMAAGDVVNADTTTGEIVASGGDITGAGIVTEAADAGDSTVLVWLGG